ncbi:VC0807 family protein [Streptomyces sp. NPDC005526]|uniref:VC0807 family protein n=1 Tax=Streptomyces sp. NPDC005526 TaxID=3156885 RepID=UPI0033ABC547
MNTIRTIAAPRTTSPDANPVPGVRPGLRRSGRTRPGPRRSGCTRPGRLGLLLDLGLSPGVFYGAQALGTGLTASLLAATVAAGARLAWTTARTRRIDGLNALMLGTYALMLLIALVARDERILLARDPATSALAGLIFLASCATPTPALAHLARRFRPRAGTDCRHAHAALRRQTAVWGTALTAEAAARFVLLFTLPTEVVPGLSTGLELAVLAPLLLWTMWDRRLLRPAAAVAPTGEADEPPSGARRPVRRGDDGESSGARGR